MKKIFLDTGYDDDFLLFGIVSQEKPHRMSWLINKHLGYQFASDDDLVIYSGKEIQQLHHRYYYTDEINHLSFYLLQNRDESLLLMNELRNIDYFIIIKGGLEFFEKTTFTRLIQSIPEVQLISELQHKHLKQRQHLNF